jgi:hypothetical protein
MRPLPPFDRIRLTNPQATRLSWAKAGGIFLGCLLASYFLPVLAHPFVPFAGFFFFFPQVAFPYDSVVVRHAGFSRAVFSDNAAAWLSVLQWGLLTVGFSWLARRLRLRYMFLLAVVVIVGATFAVAYGVTLFGARVELDGL